MILNLNFLCLFDGFLCVKSVETMNDKPEFHLTYWPICRCSKSQADFNGFPLGAQMDYSGTGCYRAHDSRLDSRRFELANGGQTVSIAIKFYPVTPPPTRGKVLRWNNGEWQKLLKTGWKWEPFVDDFSKIGDGETATQPQLATL